MSSSAEVQHTTSKSNEADAESKAKAKPGSSWKAEETHVLPKNNLPVVFTGLMACTFLAALDQTIVATALPTIVEDLGGGQNYSWAGTQVMWHVFRFVTHTNSHRRAYLLASAALSPLYAKLSDILGRKPVFYAAIITFLVGTCPPASTENQRELPRLDPRYVERPRT